MASVLRPFIIGLVLFLSILTQIETRTVSITIKKRFCFSKLYIYRLKMMMVYPILKQRDSLIHILMIHDNDILNLHQDNLHRMILVKHMSKVLNVKVVVHDEIVNVLERVLWVSLVSSLLF
jgi:hypothetical protein